MDLYLQSVRTGFRGGRVWLVVPKKKTVLLHRELYDHNVYSLRILAPSTIINTMVMNRQHTVTPSSTMSLISSFFSSPEDVCTNRLYQPTIFCFALIDYNVVNYIMGFGVCCSVLFSAFFFSSFPPLHFSCASQLIFLLVCAVLRLNRLLLG